MFRYTSACWRRRGFIAPLTCVRPAPLVQRPWTFARFESMEAGEDKSGHIKEGANKALFYFDSEHATAINGIQPLTNPAVYPMRLPWLIAYPTLRTDTNLNLLPGGKPDGAPPEKALSPLTILSAAHVAGADTAELIPRPREGGAFVKLTLSPGATAAETEEAVRAYLKKEQPKAWWSLFHSAHARLVRGKPWVEDLHRLPSARLRVEFLGKEPGEAPAEPSQELLYQFFRPYGKLVDIIPQPFDSKVLPRYAYVDFFSMRRAVMAKNCLHGLVVGEADGGGKMGTVLRISYERKAKHGWIKDWIFNHPRIFIPILVALLGALSVAVFDPYVFYNDMVVADISGYGRSSSRCTSHTSTT
jgi:RNA recognition motif. (a.k.a. RRM, RBD, or RNP domain)